MAFMKMKIVGKKWSETMRKTNKNKTTNNLLQTIEELNNLHLDTQWFENQLQQNSYNIVHTKIAMKYFKLQLGKEKIQIITCKKKK